MSRWLRVEMQDQDTGLWTAVKSILTKTVPKSYTRSFLGFKWQDKHYVPEFNEAELRKQAREYALKIKATGVVVHIMDMHYAGCSLPPEEIWRDGKWL